MPPEADPTRRFSDRVENYVRYRPGYPEGVLRTLQDEAGLPAESVVADIGSGTGISAAIFLQHGNTVFGVEPNRAMRTAAEELLRGFARFRSVEGTAESTTLPDHSVDLVTAGQAFHWFDVDRTRGEFARILRPDGRVALFWNIRRTDSTPFLRAFEALLQTHGTDYADVARRSADPLRVARLFGSGGFMRRVFANEQTLGWQPLRGRLLSSSYAPAEGQPGHEAMMEDLRRIFREHADRRTVRFEYDTEMFFGRLSPPHVSAA